MTAPSFEELDAEVFFAKAGHFQVVLRLYGMSEEIAVEELYQHFKARMLAEMRETQEPQ
jgi:hypothetical protein